MFYYRCALVFLIIAIQLDNAENRQTMKLTNMICKNHAEDYINITLCAMKAVSRDITEVSVYAQVFKKSLNNITSHAILRKYGTRNSKPVLQFTVDCCAFLRNKRRNPAAQLLYNFFGFEKYSNMNHTCPYGHDVFMNKWRLNEYQLSLVPIGVGDYILHTGWFIYNKPVADVDFRFKIYEK